MDVIIATQKTQSGTIAKEDQPYRSHLLFLLFEKDSSNLVDNPNRESTE
jgi:hypothetical protein